VTAPQAAPNVMYAAPDYLHRCNRWSGLSDALTNYVRMSDRSGVDQRTDSSPRPCEHGGASPSEGQGVRWDS
jgi:hypothetical protein